MDITVAHGRHSTGAGRRRRGALSRLARLGFTLAALAPAVVWAEPAAARIAVNHNEAVGRDQQV